MHVWSRHSMIYYLMKWISPMWRLMNMMILLAPNVFSDEQKNKIKCGKFIWKMIEGARSSIYCLFFHTMLKTMWRVSKYLFIILTFKNKHMIRIRSQENWQRNSIWKFDQNSWEIHSSQDTYLLALIYLKFFCSISNCLVI